MYEPKIYFTRLFMNAVHKAMLFQMIFWYAPPGTILHCTSPIRAGEIDEAHERMLKGDIRYCVGIDKPHWQPELGNMQ